MGMAAMRSALGMLSRRTCGSSAAASLGGRSLEIHQAYRPAASRTPPLPSLRPPGRNLEGWRRYSTEGRDPTEKAEGVLRMWWQRCRDRVRNTDIEDKVRYSAIYSLVVIGGPLLYRMSST